MPFCPKCRYEYKSEISHCPDCEVRLVAELPEEPGTKVREPEDWIELARLTSLEYADMIEEGLRSKNIPVVILSSSGHFAATGQMGASSAQPIGGGMSVMVAKEYAAAANREGQAILGEAWLEARLIEFEDE